jgi:hypothetical protein
LERSEKTSETIKPKRKGRILPNDLKILACLDEALDSYGESVKQVIYWNLEKTFGVQKESIPEYPEKFVQTLEKIFGSGANLVEGTIVKHLASLGDSSILTSANDLSLILKAARSVKN